MNPLLQDLNEEQRAAVLHGEGPLLILAGAGSGKTRVITRRVAHLILDRGVDPMAVLAITFTNKAAREMKERVLRFVPRSDLWISTFHSLGARILRRDGEAIGVPREFTIYDTYDRNQCIRGVLRDLDLDEQVHRPGAIGQRISARKNRGVAPGGADGEGAWVDPVLVRIEAAYAERMRRNAALDFDDLLIRLLELLESDHDAGKRWRDRFQQVLVDEYQDTNSIQYRITSRFASSHRNLSVCGDPDQSIYGWRGADLGNILSFEQEFAPATVVRLETNYRSTRNILQAAQAVIEHNAMRKEKALRTTAEPGAPIVEIESIDELDEARTIASLIQTLHRSGEPRSYALSEIALFYRANFLQRALERGLRDAGIPYRIAAGLEFFERREVKDVLAYLRLLLNPRDDVSFSRIVNVPLRGIGDASVDKLQGEATRLGLPLLETMGRSATRAGFTGRARGAMEGFLATIEGLRGRLDGPAEDVLEAILEATGYIAHCSDLGDAGDVDRAENVRELVASAAEYDQREPEGGARGFLSEVSLVSDVDRLDADADRVTLMTLHAAKGLEFPVVVVAGVEDGLLPHRRAVEESAGRDGLEEERRLFYVGLTRAREKLYLSRARDRSAYGGWSSGTRVGCVPSRFLAEIPDAVLERAGFGDSRHDFEDERADETSSVGLLDAAPRDPAPSAKLAPGETVRHAHFGVGRVVELRGSGANAKAVVHFRSVGQKQLLLQYAHLEKVSAHS